MIWYTYIIHIYFLGHIIILTGSNWGKILCITSMKCDGNWTKSTMGISWNVPIVFVATMGFQRYCGWKKSCITLDGWNPTNSGINHLSSGVQDFFHPPYFGQLSGCLLRSCCPFYRIEFDFPLLVPWCLKLTQSQLARCATIKSNPHGTNACPLSIRSGTLVYSPAARKL